MSSRSGLIWETVASIDSVAFSWATEIENTGCLGTYFVREYLLVLEIAQNCCLPSQVCCSKSFGNKMAVGLKQSSSAIPTASVAGNKHRCLYLRYCISRECCMPIQISFSSVGEKTWRNKSNAMLYWCRDFSLVISLELLCQGSAPWGWCCRCFWDQDAQIPFYISSVNSLWGGE